MQSYALQWKHLLLLLLHLSDLWLLHAGLLLCAGLLLLQQQRVRLLLLLLRALFVLFT